MKYLWTTEVVNKYYPKMSNKKDSPYRLCCTIVPLPGLYCWNCGIEIFDAPACPLCGCDIINVDTVCKEDLGYASQVIFPMMKHLQILGLLYNYDEYAKKARSCYTPQIIAISEDGVESFTAMELMEKIRSCPVQTQNLGQDEKLPKW